MQILYLPTPITVLLCFAMWFVINLGVALICLKIPDDSLSPERFLFRTRRWENGGRLYRALGVHHWKKLLPDGASIVKGGYRKKSLTDYSLENMNRFAMESCRAELTHLLAIFPFWIFGFIGPPSILLYMFIYALIFNLPCIIAQRYNRPRITALVEQMKARNYFV